MMMVAPQVQAQHIGQRNQDNMGSSNGHLISLRDVTKTYETEAGDFLALKSVDLEVTSGEFVAVIGKSGSGKSTLINMLTGIDRPTSGEVIIGGTPVHALREQEIAQWRGHNIGVVFQFFQLLPTLTVIENVLLPMDFCNKYSRRERLDRAMHLLELVEVEEHAYKLPTAISGGQQQRVAIARALANDPPILVADEPTGNLDSNTAERVFELFAALIKEGKTILMVTHDDDLARRVMRTVVIADGEIVNEYLAQALPTLGQTHLVSVTKQLEARSFAPGEPIVMEGAEADHFYIVTGGSVTIYLNHPGGQQICVDTLSTGQYFGEMALLTGGKRTATVRAARTTGAEVVMLDKDEFGGLLQMSEATQEEIRREASRRGEAQHKARNGDETR